MKPLSPEVLAELQQFVDEHAGRAMEEGEGAAPEPPAMEVEISTEKPEGMMGAKKCPTCGHDM